MARAEEASMAGDEGWITVHADNRLRLGPGMALLGLVWLRSYRTATN